MGIPTGKLNDPTTDLSAVTATGAGSGITVNGRPFVAAVTAASVTSGGTVKVQGSIDDGTNWFDLATVTVTADGTQLVSVDTPVHKARTNVTARTDGTYTTKMSQVR